MKMKHCYTFTDGDMEVGLYQSKLSVETKSKFTVTYGMEMWADLHYADAAARFGGAIMHSLQCAGKLETTP